MLGADLPRMHRWLNTPHVQEWYEKQPIAYEKVEAEYGPCIRGEDLTDAYFILYGEISIGYIQTYRIGDHPEYSRAVQVEEGAAGVDLFIGEVDYVHRGLGSPILKRFLHEIVFANPQTTCCILGPEPNNRIAIRAYEKAGFTYIKTVHVPGEPEPEYLMRIGSSCDGEPANLPPS